MKSPNHRASRYVLGITVAIAFVTLAQRAAQAMDAMSADMEISGKCNDSSMGFNFGPCAAATISGDDNLPLITSPAATPPSSPDTLAIDPITPSGQSYGITYTLLGDADLNGVVNGIDFGILAANFQKNVSAWTPGEFNYPNVVNGIDFGSLAANFGKGANTPASDMASLNAFAAANGLLADVPEPTSTGSIALVGILALGILPRRLLPRRA